MNGLRFVFAVFSLVYLVACGDEILCVDTVSTCDAWETPDKLVMSGYWSGKYDVGWHHMLGRNDVSMSWYRDGYEIKVRRFGIFREPFYRTRSFYGYGELEEVPQEFWANYSAAEDWMFQGSYHKAGNKLVFRGRVLANGSDIGSFRMSRPRKCIQYRQTELNRCVATWTRPKEDEGGEHGLSVTSATVSPNPVEALDDLQLSAAASRSSDELEWTVTISPVTDTTVIVGAWKKSGATFSAKGAAPVEAGDYRVRFEVADGEEVGAVNRPLKVTSEFTE